MLDVLKKLDNERDPKQATLVEDQLTVDGRLYDGFIGDGDRKTMISIQSAGSDELSGFKDQLKDKRLQQLLPLYKARNYPKPLSPDERAAWDEFCHHKLFDGGDNSRVATFFKRLEDLSAGELTKKKEFLLEELKLYGESIVPADAVG